MSGSPPPGRSAHTSGGVRSSWPSRNGSFSGSTGSAGSAWKPPPGREARPAAMIDFSPVSGSTRSSFMSGASPCRGARCPPRRSARRRACSRRARRASSASVCACMPMRTAPAARASSSAAASSAAAIPRPRALDRTHRRPNFAVPPGSISIRQVPSTSPSTATRCSASPSRPSRSPSKADALLAAEHLLAQRERGGELLLVARPADLHQERYRFMSSPGRTRCGTRPGARRRACRGGRRTR